MAVLNVRLEGDEGEALAFLEALRDAGAEVLIGTSRRRREGFHHVYATVRMPGAPAASPPVRVPAARGDRRAIGGRTRRGDRP